jgi:hypothetical protein
MNKDFTKYEQASALKELGFDEPCWAWWHIEDCDTRFCYSEQRSPIINSRETEIVGLPTFSQAFRWFREKYDWHSNILGDSLNGEFIGYYFSITEEGWINFYESCDDSKWYNTYEEAEQTCLDKLIEIIKNKQD